MDFGRTASVILAILVPVLAIGASLIRLARYFMSLARPGAPGGVIGLIGPHLSQAFLSNFIAFAVLAILFVACFRGQPALKATIDALLVVLSVGTLYAWYAMGHINPRGLGTWGPITEGGLIALAVAHGSTVIASSGASARQG